MKEMTGYFLQIFATVLLALYLILVKVFQKNEGTAIKKSFMFNAILGLFTGLIFLIVNKFTMEFTWFSFIMATVATLGVMAYTIISFQLLKKGTVALYTMFLMSGGMLVPYIWGIIVLGESIDIFNVLGIVCMLFAMVIMNGDFKNVDKKQIILCIVVFFLNGIVSISGKTQQSCKIYETTDIESFQIMSNFIKLILCLGIYFIVPKTQGESSKIRIGMIGIIFLSALIGGVASYLQLYGATDIPATVLYPIVTGGTIVFSAIASRIFFKEILKKKDIIAIAISFVGTLLFI